MQPTKITIVELKEALADLALMAAGFMHIRATAKTRRTLTASICHATDALKAEVVAQKISLDPRTMIDAYINQGGDWHDLVAAVNAEATNASLARYRREHANKTAQSTASHH